MIWPFGMWKDKKGRSAGHGSCLKIEDLRYERTQHCVKQEMTQRDSTPSQRSPNGRKCSGDTVYRLQYKNIQYILVPPQFHNHSKKKLNNIKGL